MPMFVKIDYKDGQFSWKVAQEEGQLTSYAGTELGVTLTGTAHSEVEAMKAGALAVQEVKKRRAHAAQYPKVIEIV